MTEIYKDSILKTDLTYGPIAGSKDALYRYDVEIMCMMECLGDPRPLKTSARVMQEIVKDQLEKLLLKAEMVSIFRKERKISHEDILFLMRRNLVKVKRLLKHLQTIDANPTHLTHIKAADNDIEAEEVACRKDGRRTKECMAFFAQIEDCQEITSLVNTQIEDPANTRRIMRKSYVTSCMNAEEYEKYTNKRTCASFCPMQKRKSIFKQWLLEDSLVTFDVSALAMTIVEFLARETVAELIDMVFLLREKKRVLIDCSCKESFYKILEMNDALLRTYGQTGILKRPMPPGKKAAVSNRMIEIYRNPNCRKYNVCNAANKKPSSAHLSVSQTKVESQHFKEKLMAECNKPDNELRGKSFLEKIYELRKRHALRVVKINMPNFKDSNDKIEDNTTENADMKDYTTIKGLFKPQCFRLSSNNLKTVENQNDKTTVVQETENTNSSTSEKTSETSSSSSSSNEDVDETENMEINAASDKSLDSSSLETNSGIKKISMDVIEEDDDYDDTSDKPDLESSLNEDDDITEKKEWILKVKETEKEVKLSSDETNANNNAFCIKSDMDDKLIIDAKDDNEATDNTNEEKTITIEENEALLIGVTNKSGMKLSDSEKDGKSAQKSFKLNTEPKENNDENTNIALNRIGKINDTNLFSMIQEPDNDTLKNRKRKMDNEEDNTEIISKKAKCSLVNLSTNKELITDNIKPKKLFNIDQHQSQIILSFCENTDERAIEECLNEIIADIEMAEHCLDVTSENTESCKTNNSENENFIKGIKSPKDINDKKSSENACDVSIELDSKTVLSSSGSEKSQASNFDEHSSNKSPVKEFNSLSSDKEIKGGMDNISSKLQPKTVLSSSGLNTSQAFAKAYRSYRRIPEPFPVLPREVKNNLINFPHFFKDYLNMSEGSITPNEIVAAYHQFLCKPEPILYFKERSRTDIPIISLCIAYESLSLPL